MFFQLIFATTTFYIYISIFKNIFETVGSIVEEGFIRHMMMIILRCLRWDSFPCSRRVCHQTCFTHSTLCTQRIREKCHYLVRGAFKKIHFLQGLKDRIPGNSRTVILDFGNLTYLYRTCPLNSGFFFGVSL